MIAAVVAVDENFAIGHQGGMLTSIRGDLKMFRELTSGHAVIMGRKTFDALPNGALPNRRNIVISSRAKGGFVPVSDHRGEYVLSSMEKTKELLENSGDETLFVIGGGVIYSELLPYCQRVYLTKIHKAFDVADTYFPRIDRMKEWHEIRCGEIQEENELKYQFCIYERQINNSFWDQSWNEIDQERIIQYANQLDMKKDCIIEGLLSNDAQLVCDAGCGCGAYTLKLCSFGFSVSAFDVAAGAIDIAEKLLEKAGYAAELKTASVTDTGYDDDCFDAVVSRDVIDHICKRDAMLAIHELYRIVRPGGVLLITLDHLDEEYEKEPHRINQDGDYLFSDGKWKGMCFHSYDLQEIKALIPDGAAYEVIDSDGILLKIIKQ
ncbi:MAG: dihydrofolate reductase [Clostridia bacterium]|nr:dihydrofolate reductase [Clostridia bacterium]